MESIPRTSRHLPRAASLLLSFLLGSLLMLSGCSAETDASSATEDEGTSAEADTAPEAGAAGDVEPLSSQFPSVVPLLPYDFTHVVNRDATGEYWLTMHGADFEADSEQIRAQMADAGFEEVAWLSLDESSNNGLFQNDEYLVTAKVYDEESYVKIQYDISNR